MRRVMDRFDCAQIILLDNRPVGLLKIVRDGTNWDLKQIQITPSLQSQGLATRVIQSTITEARHAGAALRLKALKTNPARRLYQRLGFAVVAQNADRIEMRLEA
jgi:GNAT superfamily N-acetyltransferase